MIDRSIDRSIIDHRSSIDRSIDRRSSIVDRRSSIVDRRSSIVDRRSSIVDRRSSIVDRRSSIVDRRSSIVDRRSSIVDRRSSIVDRRSSIVDRRSSIIDHRSSKSMIDIVDRQSTWHCPICYRIHLAITHCNENVDKAQMRRLGDGELRRKVVSMFPKRKKNKEVIVKLYGEIHRKISVIIN